MCIYVGMGLKQNQKYFIDPLWKYNINKNIVKYVQYTKIYTYTLLQYKQLTHQVKRL